MSGERPEGAGANEDVSVWARRLRVTAGFLALSGIIDLAEEGRWDLLLRLGLIALFLLLISRSLPEPLRVRLGTGAGALALLAAIPAAIFGSIWTVVAALGVSGLCFGTALALSNRLPPAPLRARLSLGVGVITLFAAASVIYGDLLVAFLAVVVAALFLGSAYDLFKRPSNRSFRRPG
jgi:hypothetical protein